MKQYVKIDRKVLFEICDAILDEPQWKPSEEQMIELGVTATATVGYYNQSGLSILTEPSIKKLGFKEGDKLEITIRKK